MIRKEGFYLGGEKIRELGVRFFYIRVIVVYGFVKVGVYIIGVGVFNFGFGVYFWRRDMLYIYVYKVCGGREIYYYIFSWVSERWVIGLFMMVRKLKVRGLIFYFKSYGIMILGGKWYFVFWEYVVKRLELFWYKGRVRSRF